MSGECEKCGEHVVDCKCESPKYESSNDALWVGCEKCGEHAIDCKCNLLDQVHPMTECRVCHSIKCPCECGVWLTIDQMMAMCMQCSHCDKPAKYLCLWGNATHVPRYCEEHVPWKDE